MKQLLFVAAFMCALSSQAWAKKVPVFDGFATPQGGLGVGSYLINDGEFDEGNFANLSVGGRMGLKLGPLYLGGSYWEGMEPGAVSDMNLDESERVRYPLPDGGRLQSIGPTIGLKMWRVLIWTTYFMEKLQQDTTVSGVDFEHTYHGSGLRVTLDVNVWDNVIVGAFYHKRSFEQYSSNHPTDSADKGDLTYPLNTTTYGISVSYLVHFSQAAKIVK